MDHVIYTAMGGARHSMENQAVVANNLANASTPGLKRNLVRCEPYLSMAKPYRRVHLPSRQRPVVISVRNDELHRQTDGRCFK